MRMTDRDVIQALECCIKPTSDCENCPYYRTDECFDMAKRDALALIQDQQAEIDNLRMVIEAVEDHIHPLPFETDFDKAIKKAKAEAIKEFAERLKVKQAFHYCVNGETIEITDMINATIDNLVKEMVGE